MKLFNVCPVATQDVAINLKNRNHAFAKFGYGPPNPDEKNHAFWMKKAKMYNAPTESIMGMLCGNCAAFIQTSAMLQCIEGGLARGDNRETAWDVTEAGELGYCEAFDFKCASARTCRAWIVGGPVTDTNSGRLK